MLDRLLAIPDRLLNRMTMYRLVVSYLGAILTIALIESGLGILDYAPGAILGTAVVGVGSCCAINALFATTFRAPLNHDSAIITGLILTLIVGPAFTQGEYVFLIWAATLAMASKYIVARHNVHIFNPAAFAVVVTSLFANQSASWWVGTSSLTPFVIVGGMLLVRKIRRGDVVWFFLWTTLFVSLAWSARDGMAPEQMWQLVVLNSPVWFLAFVMLTEPVGMPPTRPLQVAYGALAGLLAVPQMHFGTFYASPELALVIANGCAYPFRLHRRLRLTLERAISVGPGLMDFLYVPSRRLAYQPGQYMEWTMDHDRADARGKRRYFTLASSPTESTLRIGIKFAEKGSTFKRALVEQSWSESAITAAHVAGDFTLPRDPARKLAFIAGGIGVTPFRSMVKYMTDRDEKRNVAMLYANRRYEEILYRDVFEEARRAFRFRILYLLSDPSSVAAAPDRGVLSGRIDTALVQRQIPDYRDRLFYISGSPALVRSATQSLRKLGVKESDIRTDYFSGLAG